MPKIVTVLSIFCLTLVVSFSAQATDEELQSLSLVDVEEQPISLESFKGKVILLNFWATWCPPCIKEMPSMERLRNQLTGKPFEVVAINVGESPTTVSSFMLELDTELTFPILLDQDAKSFGQLGLRGLPMTLILDHEGNIIEKVLGGRDWDDKKSVDLIMQEVDKAL
ncbi:MAG: TlpA family protein disulfide reductase [Neptuniibacter sp.]|uniref:TlpA family protein disulfide reductase n=1 Tax=Neptuniibacter sp. TaxID=1962643 RepID=UPI003B5A38ED